eukprot:3878724-Prymnesium_polylepis.1
MISVRRRSRSSTARHCSSERIDHSCCGSISSTLVSLQSAAKNISPAYNTELAGHVIRILLSAHSETALSSLRQPAFELTPRRDESTSAIRRTRHQTRTQCADLTRGAAAVCRAGLHACRVWRASPSRLTILFCSALEIALPPSFLFASPLSSHICSHSVSIAPCALRLCLEARETHARASLGSPGLDGTRGSPNAGPSTAAELYAAIGELSGEDGGDDELLRDELPPNSIRRWRRAASRAARAIPKRPSVSAEPRCVSCRSGVTTSASCHVRSEASGEASLLSAAPLGSSTVCMGELVAPLTGLVGRELGLAARDCLPTATR